MAPLGVVHASGCGFPQRASSGWACLSWAHITHSLEPKSAEMLFKLPPVATCILRGEEPSMGKAAMAPRGDQRVGFNLP